MGKQGHAIKGNAVVATEILIGISAAFAITMLVLFLFSGSILPNGEEIKAGEQLQLSLGYVLSGIIFTALPSAMVFIALSVADICLITIGKKRKPLIACVVILSVFLPLFIISTLAYFVIIEYAKWLYAILIPGYACYVATLATCAIALAKENRSRNSIPDEPDRPEAQHGDMQ